MENKAVLIETKKIVMSTSEIMLSAAGSDSRDIHFNRTQLIPLDLLSESESLRQTRVEVTADFTTTYTSYESRIEADSDYSGEKKFNIQLRHEDYADGRQPIGTFEYSSDKGMIFYTILAKREDKRKEERLFTYPNKDTTIDKKICKCGTLQYGDCQKVVLASNKHDLAIVDIKAEMTDKFASDKMCAFDVHGNYALFFIVGNERFFIKRDASDRVVVEKGDEFSMYVYWSFNFNLK